MGIIAYLKDFYAYHHWANALMIQAMATAPDISPKAVSLFSHLLNTYFVWLARIEEQPSKYSVWQEHPIADFKRLNEQAYQTVIELFETKKPAFLKTIVHYQNTEGVAFQNTVVEVLTHLANHTTHHRAQIAFELRQNHVAPPATDYIFYKRM